ncbi:MAG TPA: Smr/MutS family protein [Methylomirabilota bacterium]|nr:Smr/MutS family protein [Methylomirabilota bacterium]
MQRVLFLCTHNSARSQMAEALLRRLAGDRFEVASAGTESTRVHPLAIRVMAELGLGLAGHTSKTMDGLLDRSWDYVITVCDSANERCPVFPGRTTRLHWSFDDPSRAEGTEVERLATFRRVRDEIADRLRAWLNDIPIVVPVDDSLDLHAFAPRDVPSVVDEYLRAAAAGGLTEVRIIHGRGQGVQRAVVHRVLQDHPAVAGFAGAPPERGGWGATIVAVRIDTH